MSDFVQYHKVEERGYACDKIRDPIIFTKKDANHVLGSRIWLIAGEGWDSPKKYFLCYVFLAEEVNLTEEPGFKFVVSGKPIYRFSPQASLTYLPWFKSFLKSQQNFRHGLKEISEEFIPNFESLLSESNSM